MKSPLNQSIPPFLAMLLALLATDSVVAREHPNGRWRQLETSGQEAPSERKHHVLAFDPVSNLLVMYGGEREGASADIALDETWAFDLSTMSWTEVAPNPDPSPSVDFPGPRHGHAGTFAASPSRLVIFGGRNTFGNQAATDDPFQDTWTLEVSADFEAWEWKRIDDGLPGSASYCNEFNTVSERTHSAITPVGNHLLLMGGRDFLAGGQIGAGVGDSWRLLNYLGAGPLWEHRSGYTEPPMNPNTICFGFDIYPETRYWHTYITDTGNSPHRAIVYGGEYDPPSNMSSVWSTADGANWTFHGSAPSGDYDRVFHAAVYDPVGRRMIVIGGKSSSASSGGGPIFDEVTTLDLDEPLPARSKTLNETTAEWSTLAPTGTGPGNIAEHAIAYDSNGDRILVFGGVSDAAGSNYQEPILWALEFESPPERIDDVVITPGNCNSVTLAWTATGDDGNSGTATSYDLRYSLSPITPQNFASAWQLLGEPTPAASGTLQSINLSGFEESTTYYFAMKVTDNEGNVSPMSNMVSYVATCPPAAVTIGGAKGKTNAAISWVAPGDDGNVGTAAAYDLRRSSSPITEGNFGSAIQITTGSPQVAGSTECVEVSGLVRCNTYYYALKTQDTDGNWSPMSNVLSLTQNCNGGSVICLEGGDAAIPVTPVTEFFLRVDSSTRGRSVVEFGMAPEQAGESYDVAIFDVAGRRIRVLDAGIGRVGTRSAGWDHVGEGGDPVSSGLYFVRLRVGTKVVSERIVVTR
jgi:hypothetical protein